MKESDLKNIDTNNDTVAKIIESAIQLFNEKGYAGTSINDISKGAQLSKGILYHYFQNKDELYLYCANLCIQDYIYHIEKHLQHPFSKEDAIEENVRARISFFKENPSYRNFFHQIISRKPSHLSVELIEIRSQLIQNNRRRLREIVKDIELGEGVTERDILVFTTMLQNNVSFLLQDAMDEDKKQEQIDSIIHLTKIFMNGLKGDLKL